MAKTMTKQERNDLAKLVRQRAKVAKDHAAQRKAELRADVEAQVSRIYTPDDDAAMKELYTAASSAVEEANEGLAARCRELGIPERFAPRISDPRWFGRGENALASRRVELRAAAFARIDAMEKAARSEIERASVEIQTRLIADGLTTDAARAFLAELPTVERLMPALDPKKVLGNGDRP